MNGSAKRRNEGGLQQVTIPDEDEYGTPERTRSGEDRELWERLERLEPEALEPHAMTLLERLRSGGSGADQAVALLLRMEYALLPPIRSILNGGDPPWKAAVLERVVGAMSNDIAIELAPELLSLAMSASESDAEAGVDELAEDLLSRWL